MCTAAVRVCLVIVMVLFASEEKFVKRVVMPKNHIIVFLLAEDTRP